VADTAQSTVTEALAGLVERVTFHNPENGFCVLRVKARGHRDLVTVVGNAAMITAGEFVQITGVTRGKRLVVLVGQRKALAIAVRSQGSHRRWSKLRDHLTGLPEQEIAAKRLVIAQ